MAMLYERCILSRIDNLPMDLQEENQHDFRQSRSTTTAALTNQAIVANALDRRKVVLMYSIDMSSALDLLRAEVLETMIEDVPWELKRCIVDYIAGRKMFVKIDKDLPRL